MMHYIPVGCVEGGGVQMGGKVVKAVLLLLDSFNLIIVIMADSFNLIKNDM